MKETSYIFKGISLIVRSRSVVKLTNQTITGRLGMQTTISTVNVSYQYKNCLAITVRSLIFRDSGN